MERSYPEESAGESSQIYAARMVYLTEEDEETMLGGSNTLEPMGRSLKPPCLFMSRRQVRADLALCAVRCPALCVSNEYSFKYYINTGL